MTSRLIIVEQRPTQFDAPLFAYLARSGGLDLQICYTADGSNQIPPDPEIGQAPVWDHLASCDYPRLPIDPVGRRLRWQWLAAAILHQRPRLVIINGYSPPLHAWLAWWLRRAGVRVGLRSDSTLEHTRFVGIKGRVKRALLPRWLCQYATWHPVGSLARQYLESVAGCRRPTFLFPYTVDNDWLAAEAERHRPAREQARAALGLAPADFVVLGVLKWHAREDPMTLLAGFERLLSIDPSARLILLGDGPLRNSVHQAAMRIGSAVSLQGYVPYSELPRFYAISDVFVHPAVDEPWGVSVNEAMACGLPVVVASGVGAGADLVRVGETGYIYCSGDAESLAQHLLNLSADRQGLTRMASLSRQRVDLWRYSNTQDYFQQALALDVRAR